MHSITLIRMFVVVYYYCFLRQLLWPGAGCNAFRGCSVLTGLRLKGGEKQFKNSASCSPSLWCHWTSYPNRMLLIISLFPVYQIGTLPPLGYSPSWPFWVFCLWCFLVQCSWIIKWWCSESLNIPYCRLELLYRYPNNCGFEYWSSDSTLTHCSIYPLKMY